MTIGPQESTLVPRGARVLAALIVAICVATTVSAGIFGGAALLAHVAPWAAFAGLGAYLLFWAPLLKLTPAELLVINPARTHRITWPAVQEIQTRYSLAIITGRGKITVWAAPAPGPWSSLSRMQRDPLGRPTLGQQQRRLPTTMSMLAPELVLRQWEAYRDAGLLHAVEGNGESVRWHAIPLIVLGVLLVLGVVTALLP